MSTVPAERVDDEEDGEMLRRKPKDRRGKWYRAAGGAVLTAIGGLLAVMKLREGSENGVSATSRAITAVGANETKYWGFVDSVVSDGEHEVKLIEVLSSSPPFLFSREDVDHVWCLVIENSKFSLPEAIEWIALTKKFNQVAEGRHLPTITVLADVEQLSRDDLRIVSSELLPLGAILIRWPQDCASSEQAFRVLCRQLKANYGDPDFDNAVVWGQIPVTDFLSHAV